MGEIEASTPEPASSARPGSTAASEPDRALRTSSDEHAMSAALENAAIQVRDLRTNL
jgi:hypothetical protein